MENAGVKMYARIPPCDRPTITLTVLYILNARQNTTHNFFFPSLCCHQSRTTNTFTFEYRRKSFMNCECDGKYFRRTNIAVFALNTGNGSARGCSWLFGTHHRSTMGPIEFVLFTRPIWNWMDWKSRTFRSNMPSVNWILVVHLIEISDKIVRIPSEIVCEW